MSRITIVHCLPAFSLAALLFVTACTPSDDHVQSIELMPYSLALITAWGECSEIANRFPKPTIVPVTVSTREAWHDFITIPVRHIDVKPCGS